VMFGSNCTSSKLIYRYVIVVIGDVWMYRYVVIVISGVTSIVVLVCYCSD
jgi:hypothetical protein